MDYQPRRYVRQRLAVPVHFSWRDRRGTRHRGEGTTRDISPGGVFLFARNCPPPGAAVGFSVELPPLGENIPNWKMHARGRVVRVESAHEESGLAGFAAMSEQLSVRVMESYA
jgi:hypothetical protein